MKRFFILILFLLAPVVYASGLYDDIDNEVDPQRQRVREMYAHCQDKECIDRVYRQNMEMLDRQYEYLMYIRQLQQQNNQQYYSSPQRIQIQYGYNAQGDYVPMSVGGQRIHYGYNPYGDFVPMYIGD